MIERLGYKHLETDEELRARLLEIARARQVKHGSTNAAWYLIETEKWLDKLHSDVLDSTAWDIYDTQRRIVECFP